MKKNILSICLVLLLAEAFAQKPLIDTSVYGKWSGASRCGLSPDGRYTWWASKNQITVKATNGSWQQAVRAYMLYFADNSHLAILQQSADSLGIQTLGTRKEKWITDLSSFRVSQQGKAEWLVYQLDRTDKRLIVKNLANGKNLSFSNVNGYQFNPNEKAVLLQQLKGDQITLSWLDLRALQVSTIWQGQSLNNIIFACDGDAIAFSGKNKGQAKSGVWYYHSGYSSAKSLFNKDTTNFPAGVSFNDLSAFNCTGDILFFRVKQFLAAKKPNPDLASVDIYSYKDTKMQSNQLSDLNGYRFYTYVFDLSTDKMIALTRLNEHLLEYDLRKTRDYVLVIKENGGNQYESNWNPAALGSLYLVSLNDGNRKPLFENGRIFSSYQISPGGKYVLYYDPAIKGFRTYAIATGKTHQITGTALDSWSSYETKPIDSSAQSFDNKYRWLKNDEAVLINSRTDIYQADPSGNKPFICLTGYLGHKNRFRFRVADVNIYPDDNNDLIDPSERLLLHVENLDTKDEGFCQVRTGQEKAPALLKISACSTGNVFRARNANVWLVESQSAVQFPNLFLTKDFKGYLPLTDIQPQKQYNWLTAELVNWKMPDGRMSQGVLYKPENFDPKKKYPVIFTYYEQLSGSLNHFLLPDYSAGSELNIPTYVSNGYLIFEPDIHFTPGHPGQNALDAIASAADYLGQFAWVDKQHIGLMGHSWGGFETNYVITHSQKFAAAASMSGITDFVSNYNSIRSAGYNGNNNQDDYETGQCDIGATLWQRPDLYIGNSPIFQADKVNTPVLIMANHQDGMVHYQQGIEFFLALRRLGKKVWLLQYDNGDHGVSDSIDNKDVTLRMQQFFDYYLKGKTPSVWMTTGVPANEKQVESGLELDTSGKQP